MKTNTLMNGSMVKNHISSKTGFGCSATRRTSSRSWFQACQRVLFRFLSFNFKDTFKQERHSSTFSSSSSTSPTTTVSSDSETRASEDLNGIDCHPASVSSPNVEEMIERRDPLLAANLGSTAKPTTKPYKEETPRERRDPLCSEIPEWL